MEYIDFDQIKRLHQEKGGHFFSPGATRFFNSRYPRKVIKIGDEAYFITSERFNNESPRLYTIRVCGLKTGNIVDLGAFQGHKSSARAYEVIMDIVERTEAETES